MNLLYLTISTLFVCTRGWSSTKAPFQKLLTIHQWNVMEFNFPSEWAKQQAEASGNFIPINAVPIDLQPHYNKDNKLRIFVTLPKIRKGVPYTLAIVSEKLGKNGQLLEPYPSYEAHNINGTNCDGITSAFRLAITECNQMWVIDSGSVGLNFQCPPQLLLFDLNTDKLIHRYRFNTSVYTPGASMFNIPLVNVKDPPPSGSCSRTMVYTSDVKYHGLVVYDYAQNNSWRIDNMCMYPDPDYGRLTLAGESFILMDGIFGMATDKKNLYFHPLASITEYAVPLEIIDNSTLFEEDSGNKIEEFQKFGSRTRSCTASAMDSKNNLYCFSMDPIRLVVWNVESRSSVEIPVDPEAFQFISGLKVVRIHNMEALWVISNREQIAIAGTRNFNEVNFRIGILLLPLTSNE